MEIAVTEIRDMKLIKLTGKIDWENARVLDKKIEKLIESGVTKIVFNLEEVNFLCSGAIGALMYNLNRLKKVGGTIYLISGNDYINYIFDTLKFNVVFDGLLYPSFDSFHQKVIDTPS
jgi:anti-sigma B factor antagonist